MPSQSPNGASSPEGGAKSRLPLWGRCHAKGMTERAACQRLARSCPRAGDRKSDKWPKNPANMRGLPFVRGDKWQFLWDKGSSFSRGHLSGGSNGGSRIKPGFSYHLSLLKSQVIEVTTGPPIEDKKSVQLWPKPAEAPGFSLLYGCARIKRSVQEWGILVHPDNNGKPHKHWVFSKLVHFWISSRGVYKNPVSVLLPGGEASLWRELWKTP